MSLSHTFFRSLFLSFFIYFFLFFLLLALIKNLDATTDFGNCVGYWARPRTSRTTSVQATWRRSGQILTKEATKGPRQNARHIIISNVIKFLIFRHLNIHQQLIVTDSWYSMTMETTSSHARQLSLALIWTVFSYNTISCRLIFDSPIIVEQYFSTPQLLVLLAS